MLYSSHGSVNHISIDAGSRINATGSSSVSNVGNVAQGTATYLSIIAKDSRKTQNLLKSTANTFGSE